MPITSEKVLRKMNEIQGKGGPSIGHWHILRRWLLEDEQVEESEHLTAGTLPGHVKYCICAACQDNRRK